MTLSLQDVKGNTPTIAMRDKRTKGELSIRVASSCVKAEGRFTETLSNSIFSAGKKLPKELFDIASLTTKEKGNSTEEVIRVLGPPVKDAIGVRQKDSKQ